MAKYSLPCTACERSLVVDAGQAGQTVVCQCGQALEVPTMRGLNALQRVESAPTAEQSEWNKGKGLILCGLTLATIALVVALYLQFTREPVFDEEGVLRDSTALRPSDAWRAWNYMESEGIDRQPLDVRPDAIAKSAERTRWIWVAAGVGLVGLGLAAIGAFMRPAPPQAKKGGGKRKARGPAAARHK